MFNKKDLCSFLGEAKKSTYASGNSSQKTIHDDGSIEFNYKKGNWKYIDNYFGNISFGGREIVFFKDEVVYIMAYYGKIHSDNYKKEDVYSFLKEALRMIPEDNPYRGPTEYRSNTFSYKNNFQGDIENFFGRESIFDNNGEIYSTRYIGGLIEK